MATQPGPSSRHRFSLLSGNTVPVVKPVLLLFAVALVAGCTSRSDADGPATTAPEVVVTSTPAAGATTVPTDAPVVVEVAHGTLREVTVGAPDSSLQGATTSDATRWTSTTDPEPNATYQVHLVVADELEQTSERDWTFTTGDPTTVFRARFSPDDRTVGPGMPITVTLSQPLSDEQHDAFESRLTLTTVPAVHGAWRWFSPTELHWRPESPWPAGTDVSVDANLEHFDAGDGAWGVADVHTHFSIGDTHISVVDVNAHTMSVYSNFGLVRTLPVSTGRDQYPTKAGTHVISEKDASVVMDSSTVGIPRNSADGYYETVNWSLRISNSGEFVHAAPWSTSSQGNRNVSHGCVNLSDADGQWFFDFSQVGDIVQVNGSPEQLEPTNGIGDWQIPWASWPN